MGSHRTGQMRKGDTCVSGVSADLPENSVHAFIVKFWLEETAEEVGSSLWRGHITHVPSGKRVYLNRIREIREFIAPYLSGVESHQGFREYVFRWIVHLLGGA
jgi:hypothetical protein